jgi:hypothetical protein
VESDDRSSLAASGDASGRRFCPRCGTARVGDMPFCPSCGLNLAEFDEGGLGAQPPPLQPPPLPPPVPPTVVETGTGERLSERTLPRAGFPVPPLVIVIALVVVGLVVLGLLRLPQIGGTPTPPQQASLVPSGGVAAPIVGLSILSPTEGQTVAVKDVLVIGIAPPGLGITQDVSFGLDQHTTADGTGHWAIKVGLNDGDNVLKFRIGDDHSTEKTVRVIYIPPNT